MHSSEWALVAFTILAQISVGFYLLFAAFNLWTTKKYCTEAVAFISNNSLQSIYGLLLMSVLFSFFHLGNPFNSFYAINNLGNSWLSREILALLIFVFLSGFFTYMHIKKMSSPRIRGAAAWIVAVSGVVLIYSMSKIYMLPTIPTWNSYTTPSAFYLTTIMLGAIALFTVFYINHEARAKARINLIKIDESLLKKSLKMIVLFGALIIISEVVINILQAAKHVSIVSERTGQEFTEVNGMIWYLRYRIISAFIGLLLLILANNKALKKKVNQYRWLIYPGLFLLFISQVIGRIFFYSTYIQSGI